MTNEPTLRDLMAILETLSTKEELHALATHMDERFNQVDERFQNVDHRFKEFEERVNAKFERVDQRFEQIERTFNARFTRIDAQLLELGVEVAAHGRSLRERFGA